MHRTPIRLGDFGAESPKPLWLYSQFPWVGEIKDFKETRKTIKHNKSMVPIKVSINGVNKVGKKTYTAGPDCKSTQSYPHGFGEAVQYLYQRHEEHISKHAASIRNRAVDVKVPSFPLYGPLEDEWEDAELADVMRLIS